MKKFVYLFLSAAVVYSCQTAKVVYDDAYDAATVPPVEDESAGYTDYIKDNENDHKVVVEDKKQVVLGGYYPDNQNSSLSGSTGNTDCNCRCHDTWSGFGNHACVNNTSSYTNFQGYCGSGFNSGFINDRCNCCCNCCRDWRNFDPYFSFRYGSPGILYGYYDYWGTWHSYYPWGYDPYGYSAYYGNYYGWYSPGYTYGWNNGYWYNGVWYNNGINTGNGGSNVNGGSNAVSSGNHYYGHRGAVSTESSNTTSYAHTVKGAATHDAVISETPAGEGIVVTGSAFETGGETIAGTSSDFTPVNGNTRPVSSVNANLSGGGAIISTVSSDNTVSTTTTGSTVSKETHVAAGNQFASEYVPVSPSRNTSGGQGSGTYRYESPQTTYDNSQYSSGKYTHVVNTSTDNNTTNSTSRSGSTERNSGSTNWNSGNESSGNTTTGHRTTTTTSSGSTNSGSSGGSHTTSSSRR
ncbi:MAG: hypothetical protein HYZ14_09665 [Bacteroidetes bacterium]|nr:hypothetical protein [Bacteroidota bacterium]